MWSEFKAFLTKQNVLALALAVVVGAATSRMVSSVVDGFVMPVIQRVTPMTNWETATFSLGGDASVAYGAIGAAVLNFIIVAFVAFQFGKIFIRQPAAAPAPPPRKCTYCRMVVDAEASRCPHCTSQL